MTELERAWTALEAEARPQIGWHSRRIHTESVCAIRAGIRRPSGVRAVLFEVPATAIPATLVYPECAGFTLSPESVSAGPGGIVRLVLEERLPAYREIFGSLGDEVARKVSTAPDEARAVSLLLARLAAWQRFLTEHGPGQMSDESCVGLAAELVFLERHVLPVRTAANAMQSWLGPTRAPQDFRFTGCLVEVKGSSSLSPVGFRVSNLQQLSGDAGLPLFVCHVGLAVGGPEARSLNTIVAAVRSVVLATVGGADALFEELLFQSGYLDIHAPAYEQPAYSVRAMRFFRVEDGFPRLTPGGVPAGVQSATYSVSLAACEGFETTGSECAALIGKDHV